MPPTTETSLRRTPLYARHVSAGARLVPYAGWEMPVQYTGIRDEHLAVRQGVGIFDVSHMGQVETRGPQAREFLQHMLSNDLRRLPEGGAQYSVMCREDGGVLDDLFTYRLADCIFLTITNAANHEKDLAWLQSHAGQFDVDVIDRHADFAMLAIQGPLARDAVRSVTDGALPPRMHCCERSVAGAGALVCGTGYTGEDGVELLLEPADAPGVWDALTVAGATPTGLGARDTLRLEVCFHLYGNDLSEDRGPIEAGLGWCCSPAWNRTPATSTALVDTGVTRSPVMQRVNRSWTTVSWVRTQRQVTGSIANTSRSWVSRIAYSPGRIARSRP